MAGEKRGLAFEALTAVALEQVTRSALGVAVHWNVIPSGLSITPDFTIGHDQDAPEILVLVSFPASYLNSNFKYWRNLAELWEAKVLTKSSPKVISVQFGDGMKEDLVILSRYAFDSCLFIKESGASGCLLDFVDSIAPTLPSDRSAKLEHMRSKIKAAPAETKQAYKAFTKELTAAFGRSNSFSEALWNSERKQVSKRLIGVRSAKTTNLRRGIAKLLLAKNPEKVIEALWKRSAVIGEVALEAAGATRKSIKGPMISDPDMLSLPDTLTQQQLWSVVKSISELDTIKVLVAPAHELPLMRASIFNVAERWKDLCSVAALWKELFISHSQSAEYSKMLGVPEAGYVRPGIVADSILTIMRVSSGKRQFFGNAGLIQHLAKQGASDNFSKSLERLAKNLGITKIQWRSATTVSYGFRDWMFGDARNNFSLLDFELLRVADAIAAQMSLFDPILIRSAAESVLAEWIDELVENKIGAYREFRPLDVLLEASFCQRKLQLARVNYFPTIWHNKAVLDKEPINVRAGTTTIYRSKNTLIKTQSVSDAGSTHKKKELMARAFSLKYELKKGVPTQNSLRLLLLVDGTFTQDDLRQLKASGWDELFYPNEMDRLISSVI